MKEETRSLYRKYIAEVGDLIRSLEALEPQKLNRKSADNSWSILQVLYHIVLVEENSIAYLRKKLSFNPELKNSGIGAEIRSRLLGITLISPFKFKAPKSASPDKIPENGTLQDVAQRWEKVSADWTDLLEKMSDDLPMKALYRHPRSGLLNLTQTIRFLQGHFRRHRRQIQRYLA